MYNRYNFEKSYLPQKCIIFNILSKINFKKSKIKEKYRIKFKKSCVISFLQKNLERPELGESRAPPPSKDSFISSILELLSNSKEILNSSSRSEENHTTFGNFLKIF